jgi:protein-L-isoaspartate(D-aspartate) O-methyltransferase
MTDARRAGVTIDRVQERAGPPAWRGTPEGTPPMKRLSSRCTALVMGAIVVTMALAAPPDDPHAVARANLLHEIEQQVEATAHRLNARALDPRVMEVMGRVPRHEFVPPDERTRAYANRPLPIGHGQTISQPYIVAIMTDLLELPDECSALEVGTGSGYQAAILAELCDEVRTIEIIEPLATSAAARLERLGYDNVDVRTGDGYYGWKAGAPYDAIIVTAVATHVPPPLLAQLEPGGRMILPVGTRFNVQQLVLAEKDAEGRVTTRQILPVAFVPLTGDHD